MSIPLPLIESLAMAALIEVIRSSLASLYERAGANAALDDTDRHLGAGPDRRILVGDYRPQRIEDPDLGLDVDPAQYDLGDERGIPLLEHDDRHQLRHRARAEGPLDLELLELGVDADLANEVLHIPDHSGADRARAVGDLEDLPA